MLQERDRHLLRELTHMRVIDREQAKRVAAFGSTTQVNARLLKLARAGLLRRFFSGTASGGQKALYALSKSGAKLVGVPPRGPRHRNNETVVADFFIAHQLAINDIYCELKYRPIPIPETTFQKWVCFSEPVGPEFRLIPDGYFEIGTSQKTLCSFIEVDLGNESLAVWKHKIASYLQYAVSRRFEEQFGRFQFRVLVIAPSERRKRSLQAATLTLTDKIFWFSSFDSIKRSNFWGPIWVRPKNGERRSLLQ